MTGSVLSHDGIRIAFDVLGAGEPAVVEALRDITVPVVAVNPDHKPSDVEGLRRHGVETVAMSGVGHFAMLEDPHALNRILDSVVDAFAAG